MTGTLTAHLADLAEGLHDLRRRLRTAARIEVARAIGEALREITQALICGPVRRPAPTRTADAAWNDPWEDPDDAGWHPSGASAQPRERDHEEKETVTTLPPTLLAGVAAARWAFLRTRQIGVSVVFGILVALAAHTGGPTVNAILDAWSAANDLLNYPGPHHRS